MNSDLQIWIVIGATFVAVASITAIAGSYLLRRERIRSRLAIGTVPASDASRSASPRIIDRIDDRFVGLDPGDKTKLRFELLRAGYFSLNAPKFFIVIRALTTIGFPLSGYIVSSLVATNIPLHLQILQFGVLMYLGYAGPDAYVKRRQTRLLEAYRIAFPDFLDLLLVCVTAGLSLEAALDRVGLEFKAQSPAFATNLALLSSEMRSGRGLTEALDNLSERLGLDEAKSFGMLLKQSIELGSDIGDALRIYADEMRDKRMSRAETAANLLPVKMVIPLGAFIFPVILIVILTPALIKLFGALKKVIGG